MPLKIITINIPDVYFECVNELVDLGYFPSRSEAFREAIKQFLMNEVQTNKILNPTFFRQTKQQQMEMLFK
jgi:Arc/MetJ-type ribon-helix-helix transcriptional regulator